MTRACNIAGSSEETDLSTDKGVSFGWCTILDKQIRSEIFNFVRERFAECPAIVQAHSGIGKSINQEIMKQVLLVATLLFIFGFVNAQKVANVEGKGKLEICDLKSNNSTTNCRTVENSGVSAASIGSSKIAIVYNSGKLEVCDIKSTNTTTDCRIIQISGVSNVQMSGDSRVIVTYDSGKKKACDVKSTNSLTNCRNL